MLLHLLTSVIWCPVTALCMFVECGREIHWKCYWLLFHFIRYHILAKFPNAVFNLFFVCVDVILLQHPLFWVPHHSFYVWSIFSVSAGYQLKTNCCFLWSSSMNGFDSAVTLLCLLFPQYNVHCFIVFLFHSISTIIFHVHYTIRVVSLFLYLSEGDNRKRTKRDNMWTVFFSGVLGKITTDPTT